MSRKTLVDHVALVTGSSAGLGRGIALGLACAGARVAVNYAHDRERAETVLAELEDAGGEGILVRGDIRDPDQISAIHTEIERRLGPVDILIANASGDHPQVPFEEQDWTIFQEALDYFVKSPYLLTRACLPAMKTRGWGRIVTISSDVCFRTVNHYCAYVTAKQGLIGFTRSMATELAPHGITVNTVAPGWVPVERHFQDPEFTQKKVNYETTRVPVGRVGQPEDVVAAVLYFVSQEAGFVTGQYLCVNGGVSLM